MAADGSSQSSNDALMAKKLLSYSAPELALRAGNYQQPQLPSANMADADLDTKLYSLSMELLSTHSWC